MEGTSVSIPETFNVAEYFIDRNLDAGHGDRVAILFQDQKITYREVAGQVHRVADSLPRTATGKVQRFKLRQSPVDGKQ